MGTVCCCHVPVIRIEDYEYGAHVKSPDFHLAPIEALKSTLPYPHRHDFYHLMWVISGSGSHVIDSVRYDVRPNTLYFMTPGQVHDLDLSADTLGYSISFSSEFFAFRVKNRHSETEVPVYDFDQFGACVYLSGAQVRELTRVMEGIREEYHGEPVGYQDAIWAYLHVFLIKVARMCNAAATPEAGASRNVLLSRRFKSLLEKHFRSLTEAADYARLLNVTERALNEATRQALGGTASKLIRERVMLEAKRLLLHTEVNVAEIAMMLSFDDPAYFSRCFRKHTGRSPIDYRRSLDKLHI
ncbi:helix-turn-helix domain-containing protein [Paraburkholderia acidipaludis]|uniref:helix-turn-helix domain-containing protein n=1 Tax=Paraburkholderia acidipaludis TaxID=660537 RepID=UPI000481F006|nr:helix-turn-helix domain-containing protein [Paraburkholderia acidipaludis]